MLMRKYLNIINESISHDVTVLEVRNPFFDEDGPDDDTNPWLIDVGVNYHMLGKDIPATWENPAEYADVEVTDVTDLTTGRKLNFFDLDDEDQKTIENACMEHANNPRDDF